MKIELKEQFLSLWEKYFGNAGLPIPFFYTSGDGGARRYLGYTEKMRPGLEYFLSCGNEQMEGERYIRTPEMVKEFMKNQKTLMKPDSCNLILYPGWIFMHAFETS